MNVGIVGYGAYIPCNRITVDELAGGLGDDVKKIKASLALNEKSVPGSDEDAVTLAVHASQNALIRAEIQPNQIQSIYMGSESHPYAVKPSATIVGQALGVGNDYYAADMEFACKGGTAALQATMGVVASGMCEYGLAIGADTAQAAMNDILVYTAGTGGAAFILGNNEREWCAQIIKTLSISSDTPDFWRREGAQYPEHAGRFTAEPAYFHHVITATQKMLNSSNLKPHDIDHVVFHQPNGKFPVSVAKKLGFTQAQIHLGFLVDQIGNAYAASSLLGLTAVLDQAQPSQTILLVSYGSGAGSDAFIIKTTDLMLKKQGKSDKTCDYVTKKNYVSFPEYCRMRKSC